MAARQRRLSVEVEGGRRVVLTLDPPHRCVSSTIIGGGLGSLRTWLNLQVPLDYARTDPVAHLEEEGRGLPAPLVATMTAAEVADAVKVEEGDALVIATVGLSVPLAAAGDLTLRDGPGTINIAAIVDQPLTDAGLVNAVQTLTEAKAQALGEAGIAAVNHDGVATGTATDSVVVACRPSQPPPEGVDPMTWDPPSSFAGPATPLGNDLAVATHRCITTGIDRWYRRHHPHAPSARTD